MDVKSNHYIKKIDDIYDYLYNEKDRREPEPEINYLQRLMVYETQVLQKNLQKIKNRIRTIELCNVFNIEKMSNLPQDMLYEISGFLGTEFFKLVRKCSVIENHCSHIIQQIPHIPLTELYKINKRNHFIPQNLYPEKITPTQFLLKFTTFISNEIQILHINDTYIDLIQSRIHDNYSRYYLTGNFTDIHYRINDIYKVLLGISTYTKLSIKIKNRSKYNILQVKTRPFNLRGFTYLIDTNNFIYDEINYRIIGRYDTLIDRVVNFK